LRRVLAAAALAVALIPVAVASQDGSPDYPLVTTLAGSGLPGVGDGPAATATFEGPQGLAYDARGNLYVADTPAQRIRRIDTRGMVTTVAGSGAPVLFGAGVAGGYRNGPVQHAQFSSPTGVAVASDGTIYVADSLNRCIRIIRRGVVSTFAGDPQRIGAADGPLASASFTAPRAVALDREGRLYVADPPNGIRRIADGNVTTLHVPEFAGAWTVSSYQNGNADRLIVASPTLVSLYDVTTGKSAGGMFTTNDDKSWPREGRAFVGPASAAAALSENELVYVDDLFSTVRLVQFHPPDPWQFTRVLGAQPLLNAGSRGGGFRDGRGEDALYNQPMGIAVSPSGTIAVADTGNRRIRRLGAFDRRTYETDGVRMPSAPDAKKYRIAIVGNSLIWTAMPWHQSIGGIIGDRYCAAARAAKRACNVEIYPIRVSGVAASAESQYVQTYLADGLVNAVVLFVSTPGQLDLTTDESNFGATLAPLLTQMQPQLTASHTKLLTVLMPGAYEMPNEMTYGKLTAVSAARDPGSVQQAYAGTLAAVQSTHVPYLDLWPAFFASDDRAGSQRLFRAWDHHLTVYGNGLAGNAIADRLLQSNAAR
jgi:sugar lactone lactonase YvrE